MIAGQERSTEGPDAGSDKEEKQLD